MKRKFFALILCVAFCLSIAIGCADTDTTTTPAQPTDSDELSLEGKSITFWMQMYGGDVERQNALLDDITAEFKTMTGCDVEYVLVNWGQALTKYTLASTGGEAPDVAETFFAYSWHRMGGDQYGPMQIDDVAEEVLQTRTMYEYAKAECFWDDHWYALPWRGDTRIAIYNENHFEEAGIEEFPKTYDELIEVGKKLTTYDSAGEVDRAGFIWGQGNARYDQSWFSILAGHGGILMDSGYENFQLNTPEVVASLKFMQDAIFVHEIVPTTVLDPTFSSMDAFAAEKASIVIAFGSHGIRDLENNAPQIAEVARSAVMPSVTGTGNSSIAFAAPVVVFKTTDEPEASKEFLKFFVSKDVQVKAMDTFALVNVWDDVMNDPYFTDNEWFLPVLDQNTRAVPGDMPLPEWSEIDAFPDGPVNTMCTKVVAGGDIQQAIDEAVAAIEGIMGQ